MKIFFCGACEVVTGSSFLVEVDDFKLLVDCGLFQGSKIVKELNYGDFPYEPTSLNGVVLTHAHVDHTGLVPKLIKSGYKGPVYATPETIDFCSILLPDCGYIQEMEVARKNRKRMKENQTEIKPIYTAEDARVALKSFVPIEYGEILLLSNYISLELYDAGHILGSSHVALKITEDNVTKKVVFSGDIGSSNQPFIQNPTYIQEADTLVIESTYGNRSHENKDTRLDIFQGIINDAVENGGNIIIPAFAIERTQDILFYLYQLQSQSKIPILPIYVDSPLAIAATKIFRKNTEHFDQESTELINKGQNPLEMNNLFMSETTEDSIKLNQIEQGAIIISASGMADAGRIKHHLKHNLWRENATVLFVGYQAEGTLGRRLLDGESVVTIHGDRVDVKANIVQLPGFSGHADREELLKWLQHAAKNAENIILVHGEASTLQDFSATIKELMGKQPIIPTLGEQIEFSKHQVTRLKPEKSWIKRIEEFSITDKESGELARTATRPLKHETRRKVRISDISTTYNQVRKKLTYFVNQTRKERDYPYLMNTLEKIRDLLDESIRR